jgi:predicted nicotinamide N-methyase
MPGYQVHVSQVRIGGSDFAIRALSDKQQYADPLGEAERAGISSAAWPLFGVLWPAGLVLAEEMAELPITGRRILELGCGLGLSSLVLQRRGADITASDHHPLAGEFLAANAQLNDLPPPVFRIAQWSGAHPELGRFDLIIGADVLYEREHVGLLAGFIALHAQPRAEILISDPGRNHANALTRELQAQGFTHSERRCRFELAEKPPFRGRLLRYTR